MKYIVWLTLLVQGAALPISPQQEAGVQAEIYSIYSSMVASRMTPQRANDEIYLIQEETVIDSGAPACIKAPPEDTAALAEINAEYNRRGSTGVVLTRQFILPKPYELLDRDKVAGFLKDALNATPQSLPRGAAAPVNPNPLFPRAKQVLRFSEIYFDKSHTFALAWMSIYSTTVDYTGSWRPYKKSANGVWEENRLWTACGRGAGR